MRAQEGLAACRTGRGTEQPGRTSRVSSGPGLRLRGSHRPEACCLLVSSLYDQEVEVSQVYPVGSAPAWPGLPGQW